MEEILPVPMNEIPRKSLQYKTTDYTLEFIPVIISVIILVLPVETSLPMSIEGIIFLAPIRIFGGMIMLIGIMPRIHITIRLMMRPPKLVRRDDCRNKTDNCSNNRSNNH